MIIKIKNEKILSLNYVIENIDKVFGEQKIDTILAFNLDRNKNRISDIVNYCKNIRLPSEKFKEFDSSRVEVVREFSEKDEDGNIVFLDTEKTRVKIIDVDKFNDKIKDSLFCKSI